MPQKTFHIRTRSRRVFPYGKGSSQQQAKPGVLPPGVQGVASHDRAGVVRGRQRRVIFRTSETSVGSGTLPAVGSRKGYSRLNPPPYDAVSQRDEYWRFVEWSATFPPLRKVKTQVELARQLQIDPQRFSEWKWMPKFREDVWKMVVEELEAGPVNDAIQGWVARLPVQGRAADMKLLLEWVKGFKTTSRYEGSIALDTFIRERTKERMEGAPDFSAKPVGPERKLML